MENRYPPTSALRSEATGQPAGRAIAWMDGRVVPATEASVPLTDDGFLRGDGVFERILVRRGRTHQLDGHLDRMRRSALTLDLRLPVLRQVVKDLLAAWGERDGALRLIVTRAGTIRGMVEPVSWPDAIALTTLDVPWRSALSGTKSLSYAANQWARRQAQQHDADDALIVEGDHILELPSASICIVRDGRISSPDADRLPILDSVTVRALAQAVPVERTMPTIADVMAADELFVVSATCPGMAVHTLVHGDSDRRFDAPGPVTRQVRAKFDEHIDATLDEPA